MHRAGLGNFGQPGEQSLVEEYSSLGSSALASDTAAVTIPAEACSTVARNFRCNWLRRLVRASGSGSSWSAGIVLTDRMRQTDHASSLKMCLVVEALADTMALRPYHELRKVFLAVRSRVVQSDHISSRNGFPYWRHLHIQGRRK